MKVTKVWVEKTALLCDTFIERESFQIELKKSHQLTESIPHWIPIFVEPPTVIEDIVSGFDWVVSIQTAKFFFWEKPKPIFSYWSIIGDDLSYSCT